MKNLVKVRAFSPTLRIGAVLRFDKSHLDLSFAGRERALMRSRN